MSSYYKKHNNRRVGSSIWIATKKRKEEVEGKFIPGNFTDDELQAYLLFNIIPDRFINLSV